jgi:hypothetical protein
LERFAGRHVGAVEIVAVGQLGARMPEVELNEDFAVGLEGIEVHPGLVAQFLEDLADLFLFEDAFLGDSVGGFDDLERLDEERLAGVGRVVDDAGQAPRDPARTGRTRRPPRSVQ